MLCVGPSAAVATAMCSNFIASCKTKGLPRALGDDNGDYACAGMQLQVEFFQNDHLGDEVLKEPQPYDVVTCMFAIHYFFEKKESIHTFMENVATNLKDGKQDL